MRIAGDRVTGHDLQTAFSEVAGNPITYARFSDEVLAANADLAHMASSLESGPLAEPADLILMRELNPELLSFRSWLASRDREVLDAVFGRNSEVDHSGGL